jgi:hypothetical protein
MVPPGSQLRDRQAPSPAASVLRGTDKIRVNAMQMTHGAATAHSGEAGTVGPMTTLTGTGPAIAATAADLTSAELARIYKLLTLTTALRDSTHALLDVAAFDKDLVARAGDRYRTLRAQTIAALPTGDRDEIVAYTPELPESPSLQLTSVFDGATMLAAYINVVMDCEQYAIGYRITTKKITDAGRAAFGPAGVDAPGAGDAIGWANGQYL